MKLRIKNMNLNFDYIKVDTQYSRELNLEILHIICRAGDRTPDTPLLHNLIVSALIWLLNKKKKSGHTIHFSSKCV